MNLLPAPPRPPLQRTALFLDVDGTLVELAPTPESVVVPPDLVPLLQKLHTALDGALAIVSGRTIATLDRMLGATGLPAAGVHGGEFRIDPDGAVTEVTPHLPASLQDRAWAIIDELSRRWPGVRGEDKGPAFSFHYRLAPEAEPALRQAIATLDLGSDWEILSGHAIFEIRSRGQSKGAAVRRLMTLPVFAGRDPLFVGDDRTDIDGIRAAAALGGAGIAVNGLQAEDARWALRDPQAVRAWLRSLLD
ncbi:trehalose-phosphatase [Dongia sedimenti]|uniref:Trehalose 6-phosphate phosphatase n=1 Tax=Dongia sedimenti TaxID=3064282 RepID=A0ABU0YFG3_9PROT|nr:trehalose-phosphatase [Rhodospirillaceae bacterium R-7]